MRDHRKATRVASKRPGVVQISGRNALDCTIRNVSNLGALLSFPNPIILPRAFELEFEGQGHRVSVIWQSGRLAGVRFQTPLTGVSGPQKRLWPWSRK